MTTPKQKSGTPTIDEFEELRQRVLRMEAELAVLRESEWNYRILLDESSDPIFTFYPDGQYRYVNKAFANGVGRNQSDIIGKKIWDIFPREEADKRFAAVKWVFENGSTKVLEVRVPRPEGDTYYITTVKPIFDGEGKVISVICISKEITDRKRMEQELQHLGTHDMLTGLYNRNFFETELSRLQLSRQFPIGIVVADADNLKIVNDQHGHAAGDEVIREIANVLRHSFRAEDILARIGGDEFAILLPGIDDATAVNLVERLRDSLSKLSNRLLNLSIGMAIGHEGDFLPDVMRKADDLMYQDKAGHKNKAILANK